MSCQEMEQMVGAIGFEPSPTQPFQTLAGLGWQPKHRNGSQRNNNWTRIGHCQFMGLLANPSPKYPRNPSSTSAAESAVERKDPDFQIFWLPDETLCHQLTAFVFVAN